MDLPAALPLAWLPFELGKASSAMWPPAHRLLRDQLHRLVTGEPPVNGVAGDY